MPEHAVAVTDVPHRAPAPPQLIIPPEWNATARHHPPGCVHELFETQAANTPGRVAIRFEGEELNYAELNRRANAVAARLALLGAGRGTLVGILMHRSLDLLPALLGILKSGAAYVPLDPFYPKDRLELMLDDSAAPLLVTQSSLAGLVELRGITPLLLDHGWERQAGDGAENPVHAVTREDVAYVIYTSGSTGKPKGVQVTHGGLSNFLHSMREEPGLQQSDVMLAITTLSFDIAGLELYLPLTTGARIELLSRDTASDGRRLVEALERSGATVAQATPATWRMLLESGWRGDPRLKVLCGGEAMPADLAAALLPRCASLWNMYGPTETTIWSTLEHVRAAGGSNVPVGRPIANTQIHILDASLQPVPPGEPGELHIGGTGVARGYLNRPELTAERFIPDPFSNEPGARLYKTGDEARWLPDGRVEYLDRLDNQVKLRGHRIELGEIECVLRRHPAIANAVVTLRSDAPGGAALSAYFVARATPGRRAEGRGPRAEGKEPAGECSAHELRSFLRESLPAIMVPSYYTRLDELPLTPNGKVDRKALPAPQRAASDAPATVPPSDELEVRLIRMFTEVLGVPAAGVTDDFFELGGDSLLAVRLFTRIEKELGRQLPLATLIGASTVQQIAAVLRDEGFAAPWTPLIPIQTAGAKPPFFCVHGVGGNVLNYRGLATYLGQDQPFYGLQARGLDGKQPPLTRIEEMAELYLAEVRAVQPHGPYLLGGASFGGVVAFEMARRLHELGEEVALVALFDTAPVGWSRLAGVHAADALEQSSTRRMRTHFDVLLRGPHRARYLRKKIRRVWRKIVYRSWQIAFAAFERFGRPLPPALQDVQKANYKALRDYAPGFYPGKVAFFCARDEPDEFTRDKKRGWQVLARGGVSVHEVPGDHLTMVEEPHVPSLARRLRACIDRCTTRVAPMAAAFWGALDFAAALLQAG